jgi:hypothetical protein
MERDIQGSLAAAMGGAVTLTTLSLSSRIGVEDINGTPTIWHRLIGEAYDPSQSCPSMSSRHCPEGIGMCEGEDARHFVHIRSVLMQGSCRATAMLQYGA